MSKQQVTGVTFSLLGVAALILSIGLAWMLARISHVRRVNGAGVLSVASVLLFILGVVACWLVVSSLVEG